jgi:signal transduction histidine kinase
MTPPNRTVPWSVTSIFLVCLLLLAFNAATYVWNSQSSTLLAARVNKQFELVRQLAEVQKLLVDAETGSRGYLLTADPVFLQPLSGARAALDPRLAALSASISKTDEQRTRMREAETSITELLGHLDGIVKARDRQGIVPALEMVQSGHGKELMDRIRLTLDEMEAQERGQLDMVKDKIRRTTDFTIYVAIGISVFTAIVLTVFYALIRRHLRARVGAEHALQGINESLNQQVLARTNELTLLSRHLMNVSEEERRAVARELHDALGSHLTAISIDVSTVERELRGSEAQSKRLQRALDTLQQTVEIKRAVIEGLRPSILDSLGIGRALVTLGEDFTRRTGTPCSVAVDARVAVLPPDLSIAMFRICQEALTNVTKYAAASAVRIVLTHTGRDLELMVIDDGVGMPADLSATAKTHGVIGMRERVRQFGGDFSIGSGTYGKGTAIMARIPWELPEPG